MISKKYLKFMKKIMQQLKLFMENTMKRNFKIDNLEIKFDIANKNINEAYININSNRFIIRFKTYFKKITNFEILDYKWFVELSIWIVKVLKKLISKVYFWILNLA